MFLNENMVHEQQSLPWTIMRSSMDVVHGRMIMRCPWTMIKYSWMTQPSIQWTDKRATLRKLQHVGTVNKPMIITLDSLSSSFPSTVATSIAVEEVISVLIGFRESWGSYWANNHPKVSI